MRTILVVDDNSVNRFVLHRMLQSSYRILEASTGEDAYHVAKSTKIDLILLDILMPHLDGYDTARLLKSDPKTEKTPIIFVTALTDESVRQKAMACGAVDLVTKPVCASMLKARISKIFPN